MPKKTRKEQYKYWRQINTIAISKAAGNNGINGVLLDVKALLEAIASQGEEVRVKRATIHVNAVCTAAWHNFFMTIAAMVSDQAIAAATPTVSNSVLDDELDVLTAGDYEERDFGTFRSKSDVGNILSATVDVTSFLQRCSGLLARSAILSVNLHGHRIRGRSRC